MSRATTSAIASSIVAATLVCLLPATASAQRMSAETEVTVGQSTDGTTGAAAQVRVFGITRSDWRVFLEGTWGLVTGDDYSDAFSAAYPYDRRVRPMELYGERMQTIGSGPTVAAFRAGRYRTPFGIGGRSDHAYLGFVRAPLIRYAWNWALSNTYMDLGADVMIGRPAFTVESSIGVPSDEGDAPRRHGVTATVRAQSYVGDFIVGASYITSPVADTDPRVAGRLLMRGVDARWMRGGVQLRGEWIAGESDNRSTTRGGYLDFIGHHRAMGRVTVVARLEHLDWDSASFPEISEYPRRLTAGARLRLSPHVHVHANLLRSWARQPLDPYDAERPTTTFDLALSFSHRF
jgi:hypothetical protein